MVPNLNNKIEYEYVVSAHEKLPNLLLLTLLLIGLNDLSLKKTDILKTEQTGSAAWGRTIHSQNSLPPPPRSSPRSVITTNTWPKTNFVTIYFKWIYNSVLPNNNSFSHHIIVPVQRYTRFKHDAIRIPKLEMTIADGFQQCILVRSGNTKQSYLCV